MQEEENIQQNVPLVMVAPDGKLVVKSMTVAIASAIIQHLQKLIANAVVGDE